MAPNITVREYVRWLPERESEPTSTLVLTSGENRFVDVRILKPQPGSAATEADEDVLPSSRLEWAFAGTSATELRHPKNGKAVVHSTWHHWVSSSTPDAESVTDDGDMIPQGHGRTLEQGSSVDPVTGKVKEYEEMWADVDALAVGNAGEKGGDGLKVCVVLQLQDDEHKARGVVVRVGQFCQGVLRVGEHFCLERWEWKGMKEGGWKRLVRIGDLWLPCGVATEEGRLKMDGEVKFGEYVWKVVESSHF